MSVIEITNRLLRAKDEIRKVYGDTVRLDSKSKSLLKFGRNDDVDTGAYETVWQRGGDETYPTANTIDKISSSNAGDDQEVVVEGHTISDGILTFVTQTVTLDGQTETDLPTPLARANRLYNNSSTDFAGVVYVYEDDTVTAGVPQTPANIHLQSDGANNQSLKAATSISNNDYWIITSVYGAVQRNTGSPSADLALQLREVSASSKVFRTRLEYTASRDTPSLIELDPCIIVPKNHDMRIRAAVSANNTAIYAWANGYLAEVVATSETRRGKHGFYTG